MYGVFVMSLTRLLNILKRSVDGTRRRPWLHLLSLCTLFVTFLSFALTLVTAQNLDRIVSYWIGGAEMTIYLKEGVPETDIEKLKNALSQTEEIEKVDLISESRAREIFAIEMGMHGDMVRSLPESSFPVSIEIFLKETISKSESARKLLADKISALSMVDKVESYDEWFSKILTLAKLGKLISFVLGLCALLVAILVVSSVIRTGVVSRVREIEVLEIVGATKKYIRFPFLLEGALQAALAMFLALLCMEGLLSKAESALFNIIPLIGINSLSGFGNNLSILLVIGASIAGIAGSHLSLKSISEYV